MRCRAEINALINDFKDWVSERMQTNRADEFFKLIKVYAREKGLSKEKEAFYLVLLESLQDWMIMTLNQKMNRLIIKGCQATLFFLLNLSKILDKGAFYIYNTHVCFVVGGGAFESN